MTRTAGKGISGVFSVLAAIVIGCGTGFGVPADAATTSSKGKPEATAKPPKPGVKPMPTPPKPARKPSPGFPGFTAAEKGDWREVRRLTTQA